MALEQLALLDLTCPKIGRLPAVLSRKDIPDRNEWQHNVEVILKAITDQKISKVVLARMSTFTFDNAVDAFALLKELEKLAPASNRFLFQWQRNSVFFGASPESLFRRRARQVNSEAIAGTRPRGRSNAEDQALKEELLNSKKDAFEHALVLESICENLKGKCVVLKSQQTQVMTLGHSFHLRTALQGELKGDVKDGDLVRELHPTPAVAGVPRAGALGLIKELEPFSRGWFAGVVACVGHDTADFIVAIRSALVNGRTMNVYAGAGIVEGSVAQKEWEEIDNKIENLLKVIRHGSERGSG